CGPEAGLLAQKLISHRRTLEADGHLRLALTALSTQDENLAANFPDMGVTPLHDVCRLWKACAEAVVFIQRHWPARGWVAMLVQHRDRFPGKPKKKARERMLPGH